MKKILLFVAVALFAVASVNAQAFKKKTDVLDLKVGVGGSYGVPVSVSYERGVYDINNKMAIGVGGLVGIGFDSDKWEYGKHRYTNILLGARGAWHYTGVKKLDLYAGLMLGYNIFSSSHKCDDSKDEKMYGNLLDSTSASGVLWGVYAGARYFFTPAFGVTGELGYGLAYLNLGVSFKF